MIYFLVNNNYHLWDVHLHCAEMHTLELSLIQVPHALSIVEKDNRFSAIYTFQRLNISLGNLGLIRRNYLLHHAINAAISPKREDVLLVYTEQEILNHYIIGKFKEAGAPVFLMQDGTATFALNRKNAIRLPFREKIRELILRYGYRYRYTRFLFMGYETLPILPDSTFSGICLYSDCKMPRKIPVYHIKNPSEQITSRHPEGAIFFNEDVYNFYCSFGDYLLKLRKALELSEFFSPFFFKFHPRETAEWRQKIAPILGEFSNVSIINDVPAEEIIEVYPVHYAITFFSTSAINLSYRGVQPVIIGPLTGLFDDFKPVTQLFQTLKNIGFDLPVSWSAIRPGKTYWNYVNGSFQLKDIILKR